MGDNGKQGETKGETRGDKTLGRRTHHPTQAHMWEDNGREAGRQGETRPREGRHTFQHRHMGRQGETRPSGRWGHHTMGAKGRQDMTSPSGRWTHHPTKGSNKGCNGRQRETRPSGRRAHHPTEGYKKGYNGRQDCREGGHTIQQREAPFCKGKQEGVQWERKGDKTLGKADTPSNTKAGALRKH